MHRYSLPFITALTLLFLSASSSLKAITIGSLKDFPAGTIRYSMHEGKNVHFVEVTWGGDKENTGSNGPVVQLGLAGENQPKLTKISEDALEKLFTAATKLTANYSVPRSSSGNSANRDMFQLHVGVIYDAVKLSFPANEPHLWNSAATCWSQFAEILKKEASLTLPEAKQIADAGKTSPKPGLATIADYTSVRMLVERVHRSKSDYGTISLDWNRAADGTITFQARYYSRAGDQINTTLTPAQIRPLFDELQKLAVGYRHPSFARTKTGASRNYDSITVGIMVKDQPGECLLPYFSVAASQWVEADRFWSTLIKLFPKEKQAEIIQ